MSKRALPHTLQDLAEAFAIFAKYHTNGLGEQSGEWLWSATNGDVCIDIDPEIVSPDDTSRLKELGWLPDEYKTFSFATTPSWIADE